MLFIAARGRREAARRHRSLRLPPNPLPLRALLPGAAGFLTFSLSWTRPERYSKPRRFDTVLPNARILSVIVSLRPQLVAIAYGQL
jgi:hypothetical protein